MASKRSKKKGIKGIISPVTDLFRGPSVQVTLKVLVSGFIVYHLLMIFISPNRLSMIHEKLMPYFISYSHTLSMDVSWSFYAPNPYSYFYFDYEVVYKNDRVNTFRWPPSRKEFKKNIFSYNRLISHTLFFMLSGARHVRRHLLPYLCHIHPESKEITAQAIVEDRPHFKKAQVLDPTQSLYNKENMKVWYKASRRCYHKRKSRSIDSEDILEADDFTTSEYDDEMD